MMAQIERKYQLVRLDKGDYILPSNDGRRFYRLCTYEDGPSHGLDDWPRDKTFWGVWEWIEHYAITDADDPTEWEHWSMAESWCETRKEAVQAALRLS